MSTVRMMEKSFNLDRYLKKHRPKISGPERVLNCPECKLKGKKLKLWINVKKQSGICYFCDINLPTVLDIIQFMDGLPLVEAIRVLELGSSDTARDLSSTLSDLLRDRTIEDTDDDVLRPIKLPEGFVRYKYARRIPKYFRERGIKRSRALKYRLGFCTAGYYFNRLIAPCYMGGRLYTFQARYMAKQPPPGVKKTLFPNGSKSSRVLFNYDTAKLQDRLVITEDPFSSMAVGDQGVATYGTRLSSSQLALLLRTRAREIVICWDLDAYDKARVLADRLQDFGPLVRVAKLDDDRDPDELTPGELDRVLSESHVSTFASSLADRLDSNRVPIEA